MVNFVLSKLMQLIKQNIFRILIFIFKFIPEFDFIKKAF